MWPFLTGSVLLVFTVSTAGFSGGIRWRSIGFCECDYFMIVGSGVCQPVKAFVLHFVAHFLELLLSVCQTAHLCGFSEREREREEEEEDREGASQRCFYVSSVYFYLEMATQTVKIHLQKQ